MRSFEDTEGPVRYKSVQPKIRQAYDIGVYCVACGAAILTAVMLYDGNLSFIVPERCPICGGEGTEIHKGRGK